MDVLEPLRALLRAAPALPPLPRSLVAFAPLLLLLQLLLLLLLLLHWQRCSLLLRAALY